MGLVFSGLGLGLKVQGSGLRGLRSRFDGVSLGLKVQG